MHYDVFNGDADGIIALLQLRLADPRKSCLVTGVKRDIQLVSHVEREQDVTSVTILDLSMDKNKAALLNLLAREIPVFYCDHHQAGDIPCSPHLDSLINLDAEVCTSLLINQKLKGRFVTWAIAAAFGDNLHAHANRLAQSQGLSREDTDFLCELGTLINYNGYGATLNDLHIFPTVLYQELLDYQDPFNLRNDPQSPFYLLKQGYRDDYHHLEQLVPIHQSSSCKVFELPDKAWARRISGVFGNELANQSPSLAHAVLTLNPNQQDYTVSVRAPLSDRLGADEICRQFPTGGGRKAAAGINALPKVSKSAFIRQLEAYYLK
ncbi:DHH family phosphoesterase [Vibrio sinensis]|uniref:DHH family phosphoesterase n=1 Tax=Vibrio sinensis TaxID=2302434 RepID=A0A3A6QM71_9VIBR|nr:DHH family phosphoesterase [Vibrio sinensis]RJX72338.1 DHH family phosphoesterase [Vibrio sinensis]